MMSHEFQQRRFNAGHGRARGNCRPRDQQHRNAKEARCLDFGIGRQSSGVLCHNGINAVRAEQGGIVLRLEWPARRDHGGVRQAKWMRDGIDHTNCPVMLRRGTQGIERQSPESRENTLRFVRQRCNRLTRTLEMAPPVSRHLLPRRPFERDERNAGCGARGNCIRTHLRRERMRGIEHEINFLAGQIGNQTFDAAKATAADRKGRCQRIGSPAGKRDNPVKPRIACKQPRQGTCLAGSAQQERARSMKVRTQSHDERQ